MWQEQENGSARCSGAINRRASTQHSARLARSAPLEPGENIPVLTTGPSVGHGPFLTSVSCIPIKIDINNYRISFA
jgi:hypothetical protein